MFKNKNLNEGEKELYAFLKKYSVKKYNKSSIKEIVELKIHNEQVTKLPDSIGQLTKLKSLDLSNCRLTDIPISLENLKKLEDLNLSENQLSSLPDKIGSLVNLQNLKLRGNRLFSLPESLGSLVNLRSLDISKNQLIILFGTIGKLTNLQELYLSENQLSSLPNSIGSLTNLQNLHLSKNQLSHLSNSIGCLNSLNYFDLSGNQLSNLPNNISCLNNLNYFDLSGNKLLSLPNSIGKLNKLQNINLSGINLKFLPDNIGRLKKLININLSYCHCSSLRPIIRLNPIASFEFNQYTDLKSNNYNHTVMFCKGLRVDDLPDEILNQGGEAIRQYYAQLDKEKNDLSEEELYEAKIVVVGNGDSGKTSLIKTLMGQKFKLDEPKTLGMEQHEYKMQIGGHEWLFRIFDFGGQNLYRATQTMFMSPGCLYIVLLDGRSEELPDAWLNYIESLANGSPVLLVINKFDENPRADIDRRAYLKRYPFIHEEILKFSCKERSLEMTEALRREIAHIVCSDSFGRNWPVAWNNIKSSLMDRLADRNTCIDKRAYDEICDQHGVTQPEDREIIRVACHDIGAVYSYRGEGIYIFMKPEDVVAGANRLLDIPLEESVGGYVTTETYYEKMNELYEGVSFDHTSAEGILNVLKECGIVCYIEESKKLLVASLLPEQPQESLPEFDAGWEEFLVRYQFLPLALILRFIVQNQKEGTITSWKHGMYWRDGDAQVVMEQEDNQLHFFMKGDDRTLCILREKLYNGLEELHHKMHISSAEFLLVIKKETGTAHYPYRDLLILEEMGVEEFPLPACRTVEKVSDYVRLLPGRNRPYDWKEDKNCGNTYIHVQAQKVGQIVASQEVAGDVNIENVALAEQLMAELRKTVEQDSLLKEELHEELIEKLIEMQNDLNKTPKKKTLEKWKGILTSGSSLFSLGTALGNIISSYIILFHH